MRAGGNGWHDNIVQDPNVFLPGAVPTDFDARNRLLYYQRDTAIPGDPNAPFYGTNTVYVPLKNGTVQRITINTNLNPWQNQYVAGPGTFGLDASIFKTIPIKEHVMLRFNVDFFGVLNNPGLSQPGSTGILSLQNSANSARTMQLNLRLTW
jgi:outer membrane protein assembly factor BamB